MRYSINSRFRGTILGLAIGARLGRLGATPKIHQTSVNQSQEQQNYSNPFDEQIIKPVVAGIKSLIQKGRFDLEDWHHAVGRDLSFSPLHSIIATVPLALFYHENEIKLRSNLQLALAAVGQDDPESQDIVLAVGYAIAQAMHTPLYPPELIAQTISFLGEKSIISQKLYQVKSLLEHNAGIETVATALEQQHHPSSSFALAFYCWLSTVEDFRLSIGRVIQKSSQPQFACAITGALSGAYNGLAGIPATLRQPLFSRSANLMPSGSMTTEKEMLKLCDALVAVWSGVYDQANQPADLTKVAAIAAPQVIKTR